MQVLNIVPNLQNTVAALNTGFSKNNSLNKVSKNAQKAFDTVTFTRRRRSSEDEGASEGEMSEAPKKKHGAAKLIFKGSVGILAALGLAAGGIQGYNAGSAALAQRALLDAFKENPKNVALRFVSTFASDGKLPGENGLHIEYSDPVLNPFEIKNWTEDSFPGPQSTVAYDFSGGEFASASLDIDSDKHPEIIVSVDENGNRKISYDFDSDGKIDTVEILEDEE